MRAVAVQFTQSATHVAARAHGLGDGTSAHRRNVYARKAKVLLSMRRMWMEVMGQPSGAESSRNIKLMNWRRRALQGEFGRVIPDWKSL